MIPAAACEPLRSLFFWAGCFLISGPSPALAPDILGAGRWPGFWWVAGFGRRWRFAVGIILLAQPVQGTLTLTIVGRRLFSSPKVSPTIMYALGGIARETVGSGGPWLLIAGVLGTS